MTYTCPCGDAYTECIPMLKYEDYAYVAEIICYGHVKALIYNGQDYSVSPKESTTAFSTDKKGALLKDGDGQINMLIVCDDGYSYEVSVSGSYKNLKGSEETGLENVFRITKIKSDLTITITAKVAN